MSAVPDVVLSFLLENLKQFVVANVDLIAGAQGNARDLCNQLEKLREFLTKCAEDKYRSDDFLADLAKNVKQLVYRAEDALESYIATVSKQKYRSKLKKGIYAIDHTLELRKIAKELDALKVEVQKVYSQEMPEAHKVIREMNEHKVEKESISKYPEEDDMVGFKDAVRDVMTFLKEGSTELEVISIFGMLGLGKTTLARHVYKDSTVEYQFMIRAFIEVSQEFKRGEVLFKLVRALGNVSLEEMNRMDEKQLEEAIKSYLEKRTYLIVLDDVWTVDAWDQLKMCFPNHPQKHSRVLITTRNWDVAAHASQGEPYRLRFLDEDESRELLRKRVFGTKDIDRPDLIDHEKAILGRCDGLPLTIVVVAGILRNNREASYWWKDVSKKVETYNLGKKAEDAIKLSFNHMPYYVKPCFLYLGVFREDSEIPTRLLYQLWVSEGFVPPGNADETSEDKAESYLQQLFDRSLVMVDKRRLNGRIKTIRIHDTLREFCKNQAGEEELFREIKVGEDTREISSKEDRRLCINSKVKEYITSKKTKTGKSVRSFLSFSKEVYTLPLEYISDIPKAFNLLRVLDVRSIKFTQFPPELYYTFLLKYIAMCCDSKIIPEKVSNLRYLQTLVFNTTTQRSIEIKADIWKMKQLRHLETNASATLPTTGEDFFVNENLQTLTEISPVSCKPAVFERARHLKKLGISGELDPYMSNLFETLSELKLEYLENLKLLNANTAAGLTSLPKEDKFPPNITRLTLQHTRLGWEWMSTLAKLKNLEVLKLKENAFIGEYWDTETACRFGALKVLHIGNADLFTWNASKDDFPLLTHLYLRHCKNLQNIPSDLVNISMLKQIDIYCCKPEVVNSARKLVVAKLQQGDGENNGKNTRVKLIVYPPDQ